MPSQRKLALVYDAIYPYTKGGAERRYYELGKRLGQQGYDVHLYGMKFWNGPKVIKKDGLTLHGIMKARPLYTKNGRRSIAQAILFGLSAFQLLGADLDVIDCCGFPYFSLFPAKLAAAIKRKPLFATWHEVWGREYWGEYLGKLGSIGYFVERLAAHLPTTLIAVSEMTAGRLEKDLNVHKPAHVIPNGIDFEHIRQIKPAKEQSDVIYVGRLMDFKNVDIMIRAVARLKEIGSPLRCRIIGEGPERGSLKQLASELGVEKEIQWSGFMENTDDVYAAMKASKVFVLPSSREGFGIVAIEANACDLPVLTAGYPANAARELIIEGVNGAVIETEAVFFAAAIDATLRHYKRFEHSCKDVAKHFDWAEVAAHAAGVYAG